MPPTVIKKYGNRRLYDTGDSRYVTLEELAAKIRGGTDVRVVDAQSGEDLTQATLTQIILESGSARLLPAPLLTQLVRLDADMLGEFFSRYLSSALDMYLQAKRGAQSLAHLNPFAQLPQWMGAFGGYGAPQPPPAYYPPPPRPPAEPPPPRDDDGDQDADDRRRDDDIAALRRELDELKRAGGLGKPGARRKRKG